MTSPQHPDLSTNTAPLLPPPPEVTHAWGTHWVFIILTSVKSLPFWGTSESWDEVALLQIQTPGSLLQSPKSGPLGVDMCLTHRHLRATSSLTWLFYSHIRNPALFYRLALPLHLLPHGHLSSPGLHGVSHAPRAASA